MKKFVKVGMSGPKNILQSMNTRKLEHTYAMGSARMQGDRSQDVNSKRGLEQGTRVHQRSKPKSLSFLGWDICENLLG